MEAVIFDLDGTLVDSEGVHARALDEVVRGRGLRGREEGYVGLTDRQALMLVFEDHGVDPDEPEIRSIIDEKTALVKELVISEGVRAYPGAPAFVEEIARQVPVAICTASSSHEALVAVEMTGLREVVGAVVTCCDVTRNKPDPMGYLLAAERLGADPSRCVAVEDSRNGLAAALGAGMAAVGLLHTCPREHLDGAHAIVETIGELDFEAIRAVARGAMAHGAS